MENQIEKFVIEFFNNLRCEIKRERDFVLVDNVPKSFQDIFGESCPYKLSFMNGLDDAVFAGRGSKIWNSINKYLENTGKTTLLKINFEENAIDEIKRRVRLGNCAIKNFVEKSKTNFFARFTFKTSFNYLNETEHLISEIYVYDGKIIKGDLSGYKIIEGDVKEPLQKNLEDAYGLAKEELKNRIKDKTSEIAEAIKQKLEIEIERIKSHYNNCLREISKDLNSSVEKIKELELKLRASETDDEGQAKSRLEKLKKSLIKIGNDDAINKVAKEQEFTMKDAAHKHSLNIDNKLLNTTIISYPTFCFNLYLKGDNSGRYFDVCFNPLTKEIGKIRCENCNRELDEINLCDSGHLSCKECLKKCGECHNAFCEKCLKRVCSVCGKPLCKNCFLTCPACSKYVCPNHMREDCVTGEERCVNCLRACLRCHGLASPKYFRESSDGSKICQKCLGEEKRKNLLGKIFEE